MNLPVILLIIGISTIGVLITELITLMITTLPNWVLYLGAGISIIVGAAGAWIWSYFFVPRWRRWALKNGVPEDKLLKWGIITGLIWPKGSIFKKTEFKIKD